MIEALGQDRRVVAWAAVVRCDLSCMSFFQERPPVPTVDDFQARVESLLRHLAMLRDIHAGIFKGNFFKRLFRTRNYDNEISQLDAVLGGLAETGSYFASTHKKVFRQAFAESLAVLVQAYEATAAAQEELLGVIDRAPASLTSHGMPMAVFHDRLNTLRRDDDLTDEGRTQILDLLRSADEAKGDDVFSCGDAGAGHAALACLHLKDVCQGLNAKIMGQPYSLGVYQKAVAGFDSEFAQATALLTKLLGLCSQLSAPDGHPSR